MGLRVSWAENKCQLKLLLMLKKLKSNLNFLDSEHLLIFPLISFPIVAKYFYSTEKFMSLFLLIAINICEKAVKNPLLFLAFIETL